MHDGKVCADFAVRTVQERNLTRTSASCRSQWCGCGSRHRRSRGQRGGNRHSRWSWSRATVHEQQTIQPTISLQRGRLSSDRIVLDTGSAPQVPFGFPCRTRVKCGDCVPHFVQFVFTRIIHFKVPSLRIEIARMLSNRQTMTYCRLRHCTVSTHSRY